jgi:rRNA-processing protein FCF1
LFRKPNGLTIVLYEKSLVAQGIKNDRSVKIVTDINEIVGLYLNAQNRAKYSILLPSAQNALVCDHCGKPNYLIDSQVEGLEVIFTNECGHRNRIRPPFLMYVNRFLPDFNIMMSRHLSRLINLGYFHGAEILIPNFIIECVDQFIGKKRSSAFRAELGALRQLENSGEISIFSYNDHLDIPSDATEFGKTEDRCLLEITKNTNSILITADNNLKERSMLDDRPVIFLSDKAIHAIKLLETVRTP